MLFTTSAGKIADGKRLGADEVVVSKDADAMAKHAGSFDIILDTVSADHDLNAYLALLKLDAHAWSWSAPRPSRSRAERRSACSSRAATWPARSSAGIAETQEMLDFCGTHGIVCDIEMIPIQKINEAYERMLQSDVKYRFVIDIASLKG